MAHCLSTASALEQTFLWSTEKEKKANNDQSPAQHTNAITAAAGPGDMGPRTPQHGPTPPNPARARGPGKNKRRRGCNGGQRQGGPAKKPRLRHSPARTMTSAPALVHIIQCSPTCYLGPSPTLPSSLISKVDNKPSAGACASDVNQWLARKPSPTTTTSHTYPRSPCLPPPPPPLLYSLSPLLPLHRTPLPLQLSPTPPYPH